MLFVNGRLLLVFVLKRLAERKVNAPLLVVAFKLAAFLLAAFLFSFFRTDFFLLNVFRSGLLSLLTSSPL